MAETHPGSSQNISDSRIREYLARLPIEQGTANGTTSTTSAHAGASTSHSTSLDQLEYMLAHFRMSAPDDPLERFLRPDETSDPWRFSRPGFDSFFEIPNRAIEHNRAEGPNEEGENKTRGN